MLYLMLIASVLLVADATQMRKLALIGAGCGPETIVGLSIEILARGIFEGPNNILLLNSRRLPVGEFPWTSKPVRSRSHPHDRPCSRKLRPPAKRPLEHRHLHF